jgi:hypothetical protein
MTLFSIHVKYLPWIGNSLKEETVQVLASCQRVALNKARWSVLDYAKKRKSIEMKVLAHGS